MTWLFSKALMDSVSLPSSPGLVEEYSAGSCSDGEQSAQLNVMPTQHKFWRNDKTMEFSRLSQFGLTLNLLTESRGEELLMSYLADFPAKTSASQEEVRVSMGSAADCGRKWSGSFAKWDRKLCMWKTAQSSLLGDSEEFSETWPNWGSMRSGECWEQDIFPPLTIETESGYSGEKFPTPTVCGNYNRKGLSKNSGDGLATYVRKFPTPTASAYRGWSPGHNRAHTDDRIDYTVEREAHESGQLGRLNPTWEEWLLGWPLGWTELKPLVMDRWQEWLQQHSAYLLKEPELSEA